VRSTGSSVDDGADRLDEFGGVDQAPDSDEDGTILQPRRPRLATVDPRMSEALNDTQ
jgi:hypothetical protein